jgi:thiol-disulfide isomerase/thioredoxin
LRTRVPEYTRALQALEQTAAASSAIDRLVGREEGVVEASKLDDYGPAPEFAGIAAWLNSRPLTLADLRGKVVVLDFWTYSCINCLRTLPYVKRWYDAYAGAGLVVVGVHTPEFAFESVRANVERSVRKFGITYPVALDNDYATWDAWGNRYWPAKYFIDRRGRVRFAHFGEGRYGESEAVIRTLLGEPELPRPVSPSVEAERPEGIETPETYLGYDRLARLVGPRVKRDREAQYRFPAALPRNAVAFAGEWNVGAERIVAGDHARLRLRYHARKVHLVLGVNGGVEKVDVYVDSRYARRVVVSEDGLHTLVSSRGRAAEHLLELRVSPGTQAYAFTFG